MILDRYGNPVPIEVVRESVGFVRQQLKDPTHEVTAPDPRKPELYFPDEPYEPFVCRSLK